MVNVQKFNLDYVEALLWGHYIVLSLNFVPVAIQICTYFLKSNNLSHSICRFLDNLERMEYFIFKQSVKSFHFIRNFVRQISLSQNSYNTWKLQRNYTLFETYFPFYLNKRFLNMKRVNTLC